MPQPTATLLLLFTIIITIMKSTTTAASWTSRRILPYEAPEFAKGILTNVPKGRLHLGNLPTPLYQLVHAANGDGSSTAKQDDDDDGTTILGKIAKLGVNFYVKRDDMTGGVELGGMLRFLKTHLTDDL